MNYFLGTAKLAEKLSFWISRNGNLNKVETNFSPTPTIKSLVFPSQLLFDFFQVSEVLELTGNYTGGLKKWRAFITLQSKAFFFFPLVKLTMDEVRVVFSSKYRLNSTSCLCLRSFSSRNCHLWCGFSDRLSQTTRLFSTSDQRKKQNPGHWKWKGRAFLKLFCITSFFTTVVHNSLLRVAVKLTLLWFNRSTLKRY